MQTNKYRNLDFIFEAWEVPENISDYISGHQFYAPNEFPSWLEDIEGLYAEDDILILDNMPLQPGNIIVWNEKLKGVQDTFLNKEDFEEVYFTKGNSEW